MFSLLRSQEQNAEINDLLFECKFCKSKKNACSLCPQELIWNETLAINMYYKNSGKEENLILPLASITVFLTETNLINVIVSWLQETKGFISLNLYLKN